MKQDLPELIVCSVCGKKVFIVVNVNLAVNHSPFSWKGICIECLKSNDLEERIHKKNKAWYEDNIEKTKQTLEQWQNMLKEYKDAKALEGKK